MCADSYAPGTLIARIRNFPAVIKCANGSAGARRASDSKCRMERQPGLPAGFVRPFG
jgi:hypothetical protein